jgi:thiosulfate/3-mercaptopyruvate sulfurtransferase
MSLAVFVAASVSSFANAQTSQRDGLVVSTSWLKQHAADKDLVLLHVSNRKEYDAGHIPGARWLDVDTVAPHGPMGAALMLELPEFQALHQHLESLGVADSSRIVVYFIGDEVPTATRALFTLDAAGLSNRISLLDGGLRAWKRDGNETSKETPSATRSKLTPLSPRNVVADSDFVQKHLQAKGYKVIDARAAVFYDGVQVGMGQAPAKLKGHLPGAANIPFTSVTGTDLKLKPADQLAALFKAAGVEQGDRVIAYCHIGYQGTAVVFAARTLGIDAMLYDGSFQDWARRGLPVETRR